MSLLPEGEEVRAFWLDGREMEGNDEDGDMTLRTSRIGARAGAADRLDGRVCDCCQTSSAMTSKGPIVVFRDRSETEVRDISIVRRVAGRWTSSRPVATDGWKIPGMSRERARRGGRRRAASAVAWFTGAQEKPRVLVALGRATPERPSGGRFPWTTPGRSAGWTFFLEAGGDAVVSWVTARGKDASIRLRRVGRDGRLGRPVEVAATSVARTSGFPRIEELAAGRAVVVWVEAAATTRLRAASVAAPRLD